MKRLLVFAVMAVLFVSCGSKSLKPRDKTVENLDLVRFAGTWYEMARYDNLFEAGTTDVTYEFTLENENTYVVERVSKKNGADKQSRFKLEQRNSDKPGIFKVHTWKPFFSDCRVILMAEDYSWAVVGTKNGKYLWVLARTPHIPSDDLYSVLYLISARRYDTDMLTWVKRSE